jgi:hypothetical protein
MGGVSSGVEALGAVAGTSTGISSLETCSSETGKIHIERD